MPRLIDWTCECGYHERDAMAGVEDSKPCPSCGNPLAQDWLPRTRHNAQWLDPVVVFVSNDPAKIRAGVNVRYPATNTRPTPPGYERVEIRSDRDMGRFEQAHKVLNHSRWYDNSGRGFDDSYRGEREGWTH